jgi:FkbM family methyltransferase
MSNTLKRLKRRLLRRSTPRRTTHPNVPSVTIAYNEYGAYCVPKRSLHRPACQAVLNGAVWEQDTIELMCRLSVGRDIIHAGTFFGDFLPALSKAVGPTAKIWAFEPFSESFRCAKTTMALNDLQNVELRNAGLGATSGTLGYVTMDASGLPLGGGGYIKPGGGDQQVAVVRLDDVIPPDRSIALLQLDVEGFEANALEGAKELIRRQRPVIVLETVPENFAAAFGYRFDRRVAENSVFLPAS